MHTIDLGSEVEFKIIYGGQEYKLREPMVEEIDSFKTKEGNEGAKPILDLLERLGMPREVVSKMGMSKARQLLDGLMDYITKKK